MGCRGWRWSSEASQKVPTEGSPPRSVFAEREGKHALSAEGTTLWLKAAADAFSVAPESFDRVTAPMISRAQSELHRHAPMLAGRRIFFFPDSQLEVPLARFLSRDIGLNDQIPYEKEQGIFFKEQGNRLGLQGNAGSDFGKRRILALLSEDS